MMCKHKVFFQSWKSSMWNCFGWRSLFCIVQWAFLHECWGEPSRNDHMMIDNRLCLVFVSSVVWAEHTRFQENALNKCVAITLQPLLYDGDRGSFISGNKFLITQLLSYTHCGSFKSYNLHDHCCIIDSKIYEWIPCIMSLVQRVADGMFVLPCWLDHYSSVVHCCCPSVAMLIKFQ